MKYEKKIKMIKLLNLNEKKYYFNFCRGSNLQSILENIDRKSIVAVITDNPNAKGLFIAKKYGIETSIVSKTANKQKFKDDLYQKILFYKPDLIILAGFMSILSKKIVNEFYPNILNIHPSLLPKFAGLNTHSRVLEANEINAGYRSYC